MIGYLCYELYKIDWKRSHMITPEIENDSVKDYYEYLITDNIDEEDYTYNDYIDEFGYNGELYVCFEEFWENEYLDEDYICGLLDNKKLVAMYHADIEKNCRRN